MLAPATVPEPFLRCTSADGGDRVERARDRVRGAAGQRRGKAKKPFGVTRDMSPPLSWRTSELPEARPVTVPPTVKALEAQLTTTR